MQVQERQLCELGSVLPTLSEHSTHSESAQLMKK
jgi:hypothetical protein